MGSRSDGCHLFTVSIKIDICRSDSITITFLLKFPVRVFFIFPVTLAKLIFPSGVASKARNKDAIAESFSLTRGQVTMATISSVLVINTNKGADLVKVFESQLRRPVL